VTPPVEPPTDRGANWYGTRQHIAAEWRPRTPGSKDRGSISRSLCWVETNPTEVYDQRSMDALHQQYPDSKHVIVADLPLCKKCERKTGAR
jgi:hypothetical protein